MLKTTKPILTLGRLDLATINNQVLRLDGWVASFNSGSVSGFKVSIAGVEVHKIEQTMGISSPDIQEIYPYLDSAGKARFSIEVPIIQWHFSNSLVIVTPLFNGCEGNLLITALNPSLPKPTEEYIALVGSDFEVAYYFLAYFIQMGGLAPTDRVLDIGCGVGRLAYGLAYYLKRPGSYEGFDIIGSLIDWAQQNITPRFPHFKFRPVNIYNQMYNPTGTVQAVDFIFPYADESFDFIFLTSVFTHMQAQEVQHYLEEINRVLKLGGRCFCTCFLLNEESELAIAQGLSTLDISYKLEDCFTNDLAVPESAIGYKEPLLLQWMEDCGLEVTGKYYGYWSGRSCFTSMQDIIVVEKKRAVKVQKQNDKKVQTFPVLPLENSLEKTEIIPALGSIDVAVIENQGLRLDGWAVSLNAGTVDGFKVLIAGQEFADFDLTLGIFSADVKQAYPNIENAENARFSLRIPLNSQQEQFRDAPIQLTPLFKNSQGKVIEYCLSFGHDPVLEKAEIQQQLPQPATQKPAISKLQKIQADLERSRSYLQQIQTGLGRLPSPVQPVQPGLAPLPQPIIPTESKLDNNNAQNLQSYYPNLLGLSEVSVEKFWQILNPVIESQLPFTNTTTPQISIITPTWNSSLDWFVETALSVLTQSIADWEWCIADDGSKTPEIRSVLADLAQKHPRIKIAFTEPGGISSATNHALNMASADYVCFLDHDDTLAPTALQDSLDKLSEGFDAVYSDEDKIDFSGLDYVESFFKPDWSPEYFRGVMYAGHLLCVRRELALAVGGFKSEYDGVQDYEFLLRISEVTNKIGHISKMLYHWRKIRGSIAGDINAKAGIEPLQQAAVNSHLQRLGLPAKAEPGVGGHRVNINPLPRNQNPLVSIIILVKDAEVPLEDCLKNIISQSTYPNFEVLVVESETADTPKSLNWPNQISVKSLKLQQPFTPARAYNLGAKSARGEYLVFLSDIAEIITEDWLRHLLYYAEQPDVGAVGSLLLSADRSVQHSGLVLSDKSTVNWVMKGFPSNSDGYAGSLVCAREVSAVTDSCMMVKKSEFDRIGGFSEHFFAYFQDIDFCLRLKKDGKRIILTPRAVLISHEPVRRQGYDDSVDRMLLLDHWEMDIEQGDSYYNPNFDSERNDYTIRA